MALKATSIWYDIDSFFGRINPDPAEMFCANIKVGSSSPLKAKVTPKTIMIFYPQIQNYQEIDCVAEWKGNEILRKKHKFQSEWKSFHSQIA